MIGRLQTKGMAVMGRLHGVVRVRSSCVCAGWGMGSDGEKSRNSFQVLFKVMQKQRH